MRRDRTPPPIGRAGGRQIGAAASRTATGTVIADAIAGRKTSTTAPKAWAPLGVLRGVLSPALDVVLRRAPLVHRVIRELEASVLAR